MSIALAPTPLVEVREHARGHATAAQATGAPAGSGEEWTYAG